MTKIEPNEAEIAAPKPTYSYSMDGEIFKGSYPTRDEAIGAGWEEAEIDDNEAIYTGRNVPWYPDCDWAAEIAIEQLQCAAFDVTAPDLADDFLRVSDIQRADLAKRIQCWLKSIGEWPATVWRVADVQQHHSQEDDD